MNGSIAAIVLLGFGNGTVDGSPSLVVTMGYGVSAVVEPTGRRICNLTAAPRTYDLAAAYREYDLSTADCECC